MALNSSSNSSIASLSILAEQYNRRINSATKSKTTRARIIRLTASLCRLPYLNIGTTENGMDELVYRKRLIKSLYK